MPFFSIVIPLYNKEAQIQDSLKSVLAQSFSDFEVIVVDDGSTDRSMERAKAINDSRIKFFSQENKGASQARNYGIEQAGSDFIALLDADDVWDSNHLEAFCESIEKFPKASLFCNAYRLKLADNFIHNATYNLSNPNHIQVVEDYFEASIIHPIAWTSAVCFNKKDFWELKGFDFTIPSGQDIDMWIRFALHKTVIFNPTFTTCYDKTIANSLSKGNYREKKYLFFYRYKSIEETKSSLKKYMDLNRYSVALHCKYYNDRETFRLLKNDIDKKSLNPKQKLLLAAPFFIVRLLKRFQFFLIKRNLYFTAFR